MCTPTVRQSDQRHSLPQSVRCASVGHSRTTPRPAAVAMLWWLYCDGLLRLCTVHAAKPSADPPAVSVQRCRHQPGNAAPRQARSHAMQVSGIDIRNLFLWNSVMLRLDDGMHVEYVHIKAGSACVQPGQRVRAGEVIPRRFFVACVDHPLGQSNVLYLVVVTAFGGMG